MPQLIRKYKDLNLAFRIHPIRKDIIKIVDADAVKESVKNLVLTNHFERPFHPEIGSSVTQMLFDNISPMAASHIQRAITEVINNFEPRAKLSNVKVDVEEDRNGYQATIAFFVNNLAEPVTIDFFLERLR